MAPGIADGLLLDLNRGLLADEGQHSENDENDREAQHSVRNQRCAVVVSKEVGDSCEKVFHLSSWLVRIGQFFSKLRRSGVGARTIVGQSEVKLFN